jgi:hypothetical protein
MVTGLIISLSLLIAHDTAAQPVTGLVEQALDNPDFKWNSIRSDKVILYYQPGTFAGRHRQVLLRSAEIAISEVLEFMNEPEYKRILHVFYVGSREEMNKLVGRTYTGLATWTASGVFLVCNREWRAFDKHEIAHVLTMGMWGAPDSTSRWMVEGVAIYNDGWCREYSVDEIAAELLSQNKLPSLGSLFTNFRELGEINAGIYAASFIGFIRETYGADAVRKMWKNGTGGIKELPESSTDQLEESWKTYLLNKVGDDIDVDLETINDKGCG